MNYHVPDVRSSPEFTEPTAHPGRRRWRRIPVLLWVRLRIPTLLLAAYLLRSPILAALERHVDIVAVTRMVIEILSTPVARTAAGITFGGVLLLAVVAAKRFRPLTAYMAVGLTAAILVALAYNAAVISGRRAGLVWLITAANFMPRSFFGIIKRYSRAWNALLIAGVGIVELFFAREHWLWVRRHSGTTPSPEHTSLLASGLPGLLLGSLAFAVLIRSDGLLIFEQRFRLSSDAAILERGQSFNWLDLDPTGRYLYATGHTIARLRRYDLFNPSAVPLQSQVST